MCVCVCLGLLRREWIYGRVKNREIRIPRNHSTSNGQNNCPMSWFFSRMKITERQQKAAETIKKGKRRKKRNVNGFFSPSFVRFTLILLGIYSNNLLNWTSLKFKAIWEFDMFECWAQTLNYSLNNNRKESVWFSRDWAHAACTKIPTRAYRFRLAHLKRCAQMQESKYETIRCRIVGFRFVSFFRFCHFSATPPFS